MLRRPPTTITLTNEDVTLYDDTRDERAARLASQSTFKSNPQSTPKRENVNPQNALTGNAPKGGRGGDGREREREARIVGR